MILSDKENLIVESFIDTIKYNPLVEFVYLTHDSNGINIITVCNFGDSKNLLNGTNKKELIKLITDSIRSFNIQNKENRIKFYSDDIANYYHPLEKKKKRTDDDYNLLEQERISLDEGMILLDRSIKTKENSYTKKKLKTERNLY